jgi:hypothetical protein
MEMGAATAEIDRLKSEMARILRTLEEDLAAENREAVHHHLQNFEILAGELEDRAGEEFEEPAVVSAAWSFLERGRP